MDDFGFGEAELEDEPTWRIPGLESIHSRAQLACTALEIDEVSQNEGQNTITITFKHPLRAFAQTSVNKDGVVAYAEVDAGKTVQAAPSSAGITGLESELVAMAPNTMKMCLHFYGGWHDTDMFGEDGEGKTCLAELGAYLAELRKIHEAIDLKRKTVASLQARRDDQKGRKFSDLALDSHAKKAVEEFQLDVSEETGYWDPSVLEEEWRAWYDLRKKFEAGLEEEGEEEEEEEQEEDDFYEDEGRYESRRARRRILSDLRNDYERALRAAGCAATKAKTAAKGLFLKDVDVVEDGGIAPRTCSVQVVIFSAVGHAKVVLLEHKHHARARMSFFEEHAFMKAQVHTVDPETWTFKVADDLAGTLDSFTLFGMDCHHRTGENTYSLASASDVQKLALAIFGKKSGKLCLSNWAAFHVFMLAAGANVDPFTEMMYAEVCPLAYLQMKFHRKKQPTDQK